MPNTTESYFENCLFFTANSLAREITRLAEAEFGKLGLSSSHAFLLMLVVERPGIPQKELAAELNLAQSTVSRFVDNLVRRGIVAKQAEGRVVHVHPTDDGHRLLPEIHAAWKALYENYCRILGKEAAEKLTVDNREAFRLLGGNR